MENTFVPNDEYISGLIRHSILTKEKNNPRQVQESNKRLLQIELKLTSEEIIKNTKIAFKN